MAAAVSDAEAAQFRATGVLLKPAFFTGDEAAALRRAVDELRGRGLMGNILVDGATENLQMSWMSEHSRLCQVLPWEPRVLQAVSRLLAPADRLEVQYDQVFHKPAKTGAGTAFHNDNAYFKIRDPLRGVGMCESRAINHPLPGRVASLTASLGQGSRWTTARWQTARCMSPLGGRTRPRLPTEWIQNNMGAS